MTVKENMKVWKESLTETKTMSKREFLLMITVCILGGMVFGLLFSPRKNVLIGSLNGNNSANNNENNSRKADEQDKEK